MEENNEQAIVDMVVPKKKSKRVTKKEKDGLRPKGHARSADQPEGCAGQNNRIVSRGMRYISFSPPMNKAGHRKRIEAT